MAIEEMVLLNMTFDRQDLNDVLINLESSKCFYPEDVSKINHGEDMNHVEYHDCYDKLLERIQHIAYDMNLHFDMILGYKRVLNFQKESQYLDQLENEIQKIKDVKNQLGMDKEENEKTLTMLEHMNLSEIDLDQLKACHYIQVKFGRLSKSHLSRLKYYEDKPFIFNNLGEDKHYVWCCYLVTNDYQLEIDNSFQALGFEEIKIPSFVHGTMEDAKKELKEEIHAMDEYILRMDQKMTVLREKHRIDLSQLFETVCFLKKIEELKTFVVDYQSQYAIYGFIPRRAISQFQEKFLDISSIKYQELPVDAFKQQDVIAPIVVHNLKIVEPFERMSHIQSSDDLDTTIAFAILYYVVFIFFLGDLGVGALITLLGLLMRKKKVSHLFISLGIATILGGLIYGTLFYGIHLYPAIVFPLSTIYKIVDGLLILFAGTMTIRTFQKMFKHSSLLEKMLSTKGMCGLIVLYTVLIYIYTVYELHMDISIKPFAIVIIACLALILIKSLIIKKSIE